MNYEQWEKLVPEAITRDSLWKMKAYRLGVFIGDVGWRDVSELVQDRRTLRESDAPYQTNLNNSSLPKPVNELDHLLQNISFAES